MTPTMNVSVSAYCTKAPEPGSASSLKAVNNTIDAAVVGPDTRCLDDPYNAAMTAGTMAE